MLIHKRIAVGGAIVHTGTPMKILEFAFIAYPVTDLARARAFYEGPLGLVPATLHEYSPSVEYEVGPHVLMITAVPMLKPSSDGPCLSLEVEDFEDAIRDLRQHEVTFVREPYQAPLCRVAVVLDPDGNKLIIHKRNA